MTYLIEYMKHENYRIISRGSDYVYFGNGENIIHFYLNDDKWIMEK